MKTTPCFPARGWAALAVILTLAPVVLSVKAADASPPVRMSYQGYLTDANAVPLGNTAPRNYDVVFRIYDASSGGIKKFTEQQTITVDKGYFSVVLGEGSVVGTEPHDLAAAFADATTSDRYIGVTVTNPSLGSEVAPRLQLLTSPYSFTAKYARGLVDNSGSNVVVVSATQVGIGKTPAKKLDVNGDVNATKYYGDGSALTGIITAANADTVVLNAARIPSLDASKITTGTLGADRVPSLDATKITTGTLGDARLSANIPRLGATANTFAGTVNATTFNGSGTIPLGGIIMWSGATVPTGWALCNGQTVNGYTTPDLRDRFVVGSGSSYAVGNTGGANTVALTTAQMPNHDHTFWDYYFAEANNMGVAYGYYTGVNRVGSGDTDTDNSYLFHVDNWTSAVGSGSAHENRPPYYALAFIMRVQ